ncbi:caspase-14-like isoform X2 [Petromyzon marinus]|uniref:caspase-14-like isoform X2 n=1 Tax=Petromyzon marinus TaxID=7757 RepID=UPI003F709874
MAVPPRNDYASSLVVKNKRKLVDCLSECLPQFLGARSGQVVALGPYDKDFARDLVDVFKKDGGRAAWFLLALKELQAERGDVREALKNVSWTDGAFSAFTRKESSDAPDGMQIGIPSRIFQNPYIIKSGGIHAFILNVMHSGRMYRNGSERDVSLLETLFGEMKANVTSGAKQHTLGIMEDLQEFKRQVHELEPDCVVICLMSHGRKNCILGNDKGELELQWVFDEFNSKNCEALQNKPKVFIVQACRGEEKDNVEADSVSETPLRPQKYADMLKVFSSPEDHLSFRKPEEGSLLIQNIGKVFLQHMNTMHVMDMMTMVRGSWREDHLDPR